MSNPENITTTEKISATEPTVGKLIVFEGADGCGKTTQLYRLHRWLLQSPFSAVPQAIQVTKEPGSTALGRQLRQILLAPVSDDEGVEPTAELLLYAADRAQHVQCFLKPCLARGAWVLCDRHCDSTVAYQGFGRGLDLSLIEQLNSIATAGLVSDLTLWLDLPPEQTYERLSRRGAVDRMEQAGLDFQQRVYEGFQWLAERHRDRIVRIDATGDETTVSQRIQAVVQQKLAPENTGD